MNATERRDLNVSEMHRESVSSQRVASALRVNSGTAEDGSKSLRHTRARSPKATGSRSSLPTSPSATCEPLHMTRGAVRRLSQSSPEQAPPPASDRARASSGFASPTRQTCKSTRSKTAETADSSSGSREEKDGAGSVQSARRGSSYTEQGAGKRPRNNGQSEADFVHQLQYAAAVAQAAQTTPTPSTSSTLSDASYLTQALAAAMRQGAPTMPPEIFETLYRNADPHSVLQMLTTLQAFGVPTETASQWLRPEVTVQTVQGQGVASNLKDVGTQNPSISDAVARQHSLAEMPTDLEPSAKKPKVSVPSNAVDSLLVKSSGQHQCDACSRSFSSASGLAKHKLTHSDERKFICLVCGRGFKRQDHLNSHAMTHRENKPFRCSFEGCSKSYCDNRSLRRHMESHHTDEASQGTVASEIKQTAEETGVGSNVEMPSNGSNWKVQFEGQESNVAPVQSANETVIHLSSDSPKSGLSERAGSVSVCIAAEITPTNACQSQLNEVRIPTLAASSSDAQLPASNFGAQPPDLVNISHPIMPSPHNQSSTLVPVPAFVTSLTPSTISLVDATLTANRMPGTQPAVAVAPQQVVEPVYPHSTASEAYQSYLAAMARKKQDEQIAKQSEVVLPGVGLGLDVKSVIQQASATHGLAAPMSTASQWTQSLPMCAPSMPTAYLPPYQPPSYTMTAGSSPRYPYSLASNESVLQLPPSPFSVQPNEAQLLAAIMAAPPSPLPLFNVGSWPAAAALGIGSPYIFQQMLATLMQQAASSPSLHGLPSGMTSPGPVYMQQPVTSSVTSNESPGVKKDGDCAKLTSKVGAKPAPSGGAAGQVQCPICERFFRNVKSLNGHMRLHGGYEGHKTASNNSTDKPVSQKMKPLEDTPTPFGALLKAVEVTKERELACETASDTGSREVKKQVKSKEKTQEVRFREEPTLMARSPSDGSRGSSFDEAFTVFSSEEDNFVVDDADPIHLEQACVSSGSESELSLLSSPSRPDRDTNILSPTPSPSNGGAARKKKRPENLVLKSEPPSVFNDSDDLESVRPTTPPPYTPPPILSPRVTGGLLGSPLRSPRMSLLGTPVITPHSAITPGNSKFNIPWIPRRISTDMGGLEQEVTLTPKINIGPHFQAEVPPLADKLSRHDALKTKHRATKVWSPMSNISPKKSRELDTYFELSRSGLIPFSGSNKEFAHHILFWCKGNVKASVKILLSGKSSLPPEHPMDTYRYAGSSRWMRPDRLIFKKAWRVHGKQFRRIHTALDGRKTMKEVIEYYYFWKKYCSSEYRGRTRRDSEEIDSEEEFHNGPPFECEFPGCEAAFPTRQGLNGHIRIHGGNFVYRIETRRARRDEKQRQRALREPSIQGLSLTPSPVHQKIEWDDEEPIHSVANSNQSHVSYTRQETALVQPPLPGYAAMNPFIGLAPPHGHPSFLPLTLSSGLTDPQMLGVQANLAHLTGLLPPQDLSSSPASDKGSKRVSGGRSTPLAEGKPEFKCKVCGRVFAKVKSRSAHMKIHSSRSDHY